MANPLLIISDCGMRISVYSPIAYQSAICNLVSMLFNPQSEIRTPKSGNPQLGVEP
jgi:hypothetical protein